MRLGAFRIVVGVVHLSPGNKSLFFSSFPSMGPCVLPLLAVHAVFSLAHPSPSLRVNLLSHTNTLPPLPTLSPINPTVKSTKKPSSHRGRDRPRVSG